MEVLSPCHQSQEGSAVRRAQGRRGHPVGEGRTCPARRNELRSNFNRCRANRRQESRARKQ
eukprot:1865908-Lingulodinium_polyedra.AAC.1